jgi:AcrR family transcriptional regulator
MEDQTLDVVRKPRADAARNRDRLLQAATAVFNAGGPDASLEAVAKRAGVGIGTLYRHFPTREALYEAVYRREVEQLVELAEHLKKEASPVAALRRWLRAAIDFVATKKGMSAALALAASGTSELKAYSTDRLTKAIGALLDRAAAAGDVRSGISAEDVLRAFAGMCMLHDQPGWQASVARLLDIFVDGLFVQTGRETRPALQRTSVEKSPKNKSRRRASRKSRE